MSKTMRSCMAFICFVMTMLIAGSVSQVEPVYAADGMTRAEWIHNLTEVFEMTVEGDNYPDNYYRDISAANSSYRDIMVATEFGVIDLEAGKEFQPEEALTREFAAHTLNYCLGFQREDEFYTYSDVEEVSEKYRGDAQTAIERGWFAPLNGTFSPERAVTSSEAAMMINDAKTWLRATEIDQNHDNSFTYQNEFIEVPEEVPVELEEDGTVKIYDTSVTISEGDKFIVYESGLPQAFEAKTVENEGGMLVVSTEKIDNDEAIKTADAQGITEGDLSLVTPAEGVDVYYEEESAADLSPQISPMNFLMQREMTLRAVSGNKKVKSMILSKKIGGSCKVEAKLSSLRVEYRIDGINDVYVAVSGDARVVGTGSFSNEGMSTITLGSINVGGIADVTIQAKMLVTGRIEITYDTDFTAGVQYTSGDGFRLVKSFHKKSFTIASEIKMTTGLVASANVDKIPGICGRIYAEIGAKTTISNTTRPGGNPAVCTHVLSYMYAEAGVSVSVGTGRLSKSFSQTVVIFDAKNSPVRVAYHYEDKVLKALCSVDPNGYYYTGVGSRYGISSSGYGVGDGGQLVPIFTYTVDDDGNATITGYKGNTYMVSVPDEIDGHPVTAIGDFAFKGNTSFSMLVLPEGVTTINWCAFQECTKLTKVALPESLTAIVGYAFGGCKSLSEVNIPSKIETKSNSGVFEGCDALKNITFNKGITTIPSYLFRNCTGLNVMTIPNTVTTVETSAFANCTNLTEIKIPETVTMIGWAAFEKCTKLTKVTLPESLTAIAGYAFGGCKSLSEVNIPSKLVTKSNSGAFEGCDALKNITFNKGITTIPSYLFSGCTGLNIMTIPETVTTVEASAFANCTNLTEINIPDTVKNLGTSAFSGCTSMEKAHIPEDWTEISSGTFNGCTSLKEVNLPKALLKIGSSAFEECDALVEVTFPENLQSIESRGYQGCSALKKVTFPEKKDGTITIGNSAFAKCDVLTDVGLSESISKIGSYAFEYCTSLEKITFPDSLRSLGDYALQYCEALSDVNLGAGLTEIPQYCFFADRSLESIICPQQMTKVNGHAFGNATAFREITLNRRITAIDSTAFSYPAKLTIYGIAGTYPETFATDQEITFVPLNVPAKSIRLNKGECRLARGDSFQLTAAIAPVNSSDKLIWASLNEDIVTVSETGMLKGISVGTAKVTATAGKVTVISEVKVYEKVNGVYLDTYSKTIKTGETFWLTATVSPKNATDQSVRWSSSDEKVAKVGTTGLVSAISAGTATIEVITVDGGYRKTCNVTVESQPEPSLPPDVKPSPTPGSTDIPTDAPVLKADSALEITADGKLMGLIQNKNSVKEIREQFSQDDLIIKDIGGNVLAETALLGTGATVSVMDGDMVKASCEVVLVGDINGDGKVNGKDVSMLARSLVGKATLTKAQEKAAEMIRDGAINGKDVSMLARSLVGKATISSQAK